MKIQNLALFVPLVAFVPSNTSAGLTFNIPNVNYVSFQALNGASSDPAVYMTPKYFGKTYQSFGWSETSIASYTPLEGCGGDCKKVKAASVPSWVAGPINVDVLSGGWSIQDKDTSVSPPVYYSRSYNFTSRDEVKTHEDGHVEVLKWRENKKHSLWLSKVQSFTTSCKTTQSDAESEWDDYSDAAKAGAFSATGLAAAVTKGDNYHGYAYTTQALTRWKDSNPNWYSAQNVASILNGETVTFDSGPISAYPKADDEACEDEEDEDDPCE